MRITVLWIVLIGIYATTFAASYGNQRKIYSKSEDEIDVIEEHVSFDPTWGYREWMFITGKSDMTKIKIFYIAPKGRVITYMCRYFFKQNDLNENSKDQYVEIRNKTNNIVFSAEFADGTGSIETINSGSNELYVETYLSLGSFLDCTFYAIPKEDNDDNDRDQSDIPAKEVEMDLNTNKRKKEMVKKAVPGGGIKRIHYKASPNTVLSYRCNYNLMENNSNDDHYDEVAEDGTEQFLLLKNSAGDIILYKEINDKDVSQTKMKNSKSNELYLEYYLHVGNHINCVFMAKSKKVGKSINGKGGKKTIRNKLAKNNNNNNKEKEGNNVTL